MKTDIISLLLIKWGYNLGQSVFPCAANDNDLAPLLHDLKLLLIMFDEGSQDNSNMWVAPVLFQSPRQHFQ